jgi:catechol 2,3-dioxygenase-like lactoylglutathione lyase family enzyme
MSSQNLKILWLVSLLAISVGCFSRCTRSDHTLNNVFRTPSCTLKSFLSALLWLSTALNAHAQSTDLTGIAHVALRVNDLQKSREFYHKLGFEQAFDFVDNGKTSVAYVKVNDRQFIELIPRTSDSQPGGILHTCFEVADIESLHKAYLERGLQPTEPKKARAGNLLFAMHGPDDQLLEYTQYMPGSLHSLDRGKHIGDRISTHMLEATTPVRDLADERAYYTDKLAFKSTASDGNEMLAAGSSGDKVELEVGPPDAKPRVVFTVANVRDAAHDLRKRGFKVQKSHHAVSVTDPDGAVIVFVASAPGTKL